VEGENLCPNVIAVLRLSPYIRLSKGWVFRDAHQYTVRPGQRGAKKFQAQYGDRLVCIRYRSDERSNKRFKTVELIVEERPWTPRPRINGKAIVLVKVAFSETEIRRKVKDAGGVWNRDKQSWQLRYDRAVALGLRDRLLKTAVS